ncbi:MAG: hypothetical protein P1V51_06550 [Deltaproteobacteria bacterium]|nr:hypothetical protein [Deltaproteobacteria bacterium]
MNRTSLASLALAPLAALLLLGGCPGGAPEPQCRVDDDCSGTLRCVSGSCEDLGPTPCTSDGECPTGQTCQAGFCEAGSSLCASDLDCDAGQTCDLFTGACVGSGGCQSDAQCAPPGTICQANACVPGCQTVPCSGVEICNQTTGRCEADPGCSSDSQCGVPAMVCEGGACVAGCGTAGCPTDAYCDSTTGRCVSGCRNDGDCNPPARVCLFGACADGCGSAGCGGVEVCNTATGRCEIDTSCATDGDCAPPDSICEGTTCVSGCTLAGGCALETYCDSGRGRCAPGCLTDGDCGAPGRVCDTTAGSCEDGCATLGCAVGNTCNQATGHCQPGCATDADCAVPDDVCEGNSCVPGCLTAGCTLGNLCDATTGRCFPGCNVDVDCAVPSQVCDTSTSPGSCVAGCVTVGCSVGNYCDTTTGRCAAGCLADTDCDLPAEVCDGSTTPGACAAGCSVTGCLAGELCAGATTGRCETPGSLSLGQPCTEHVQCQSDFCLVLTAGGLCSQPCSDSAQCPADFWCLDGLTAPGSYLCWHESQFATDFGNDLAGAVCSSTVNNCKSGWCNNVAGQCTDTCQRDADCAATGPGTTCTHLTYNNDTISDLVCNTAYSGGGTGAICNSSATPANSGCARGACLSYGVTSMCADPCCTSNDCPSGFVCGNVGGLGGTIFRMCVQEPTATNTGAIGSDCDPATGAPCRSGLCLTDALGNFCSDTCCTHADCGADMRCEEIPLPDENNPTELIPLCMRR